VRPWATYRHGRRERRLAGTFGTTTVSVPRARVEDEAGEVGEWRSQALIASLYLPGTDTRRVERALYALFRVAIGKDVVGRARRKVKVEREARVAPAASPRRTSSGRSSTAPS
jgi:transposase-like protein